MKRCVPDFKVKVQRGRFDETIDSIYIWASNTQTWYILKIICLNKHGCLFVTVKDCLTWMNLVECAITCFLHAPLGGELYCSVTIYSRRRRFPCCVHPSVLEVFVAYIFTSVLFCLSVYGDYRHFNKTPPRWVMTVSRSITKLVKMFAFESELRERVMWGNSKLSS